VDEVRQIGVPLFAAIRNLETDNRIQVIRNCVGNVCDWYIEKRRLDLTPNQRDVIKKAVGMIIVKHVVCEKTNQSLSSKSDSACKKPSKKEETSKKCAIERGALSEAMATNRSNLIDFWTKQHGREVLKVCFDTQDLPEGVIPYTDIETTTLQFEGELNFEASHWLQAAFSGSGAGESKTFFEFDSPNLIVALQGAAQLSDTSGEGPGHSFCGSIGTNDCHYNYYREDEYNALPDASILYQCALVESMAHFLPKKSYTEAELKGYIDTFEHDARMAYIDDAVLSCFFEAVLSYKPVKERREFATLTMTHTKESNHRARAIVESFCTEDSSILAELTTNVFFKRLSVGHIDKAFKDMLVTRPEQNSRVRQFVDPRVTGPTSLLVAIGKRLQANVQAEYTTITGDGSITYDNVYSEAILTKIKDTLNRKLTELMTRPEEPLASAINTLMNQSYEEAIIIAKEAITRAEEAEAALVEEKAKHNQTVDLFKKIEERRKSVNKTKKNIKKLESEKELQYRVLSENLPLAPNAIEDWVDEHDIAKKASILVRAERKLLKKRIESQRKKSKLLELESQIPHITPNKINKLIKKSKKYNETRKSYKNRLKSFPNTNTSRNIRKKKQKQRRKNNQEEQKRQRRAVFFRPMGTPL
jgi:hypothetical protein